jgi:hypothetical protein
VAASNVVSGRHCRTADTMLYRSQGMSGMSIVKGLACACGMLMFSG